jgi:hypothetical protein
VSPEAFGVARLREAALAAWTQHPVRFREDANTEEDHARGYYRDRVVVELAQNAADAAARAGIGGHLELRLVTTDRGGVLVAANTGAPLDDAGVASLASLRASAKRDLGGSPVGRFGVGFAAVRSVADEITVGSVTGTVHFSLDEAAATLAVPARQVADLGAELALRGPWIPLLRLPFDGAAARHAAYLPEPGGEWDTAVVLTLRDAEAVDQVRRQLDVDDTLLLALPALARVTLRVEDAPPRVIEDVADRWMIATGSGLLDAGLLADRPVEERERAGWQITWAVRRRGEPGPAGVVHAPTPTDEPCTLPALLIGTFPLDATRRHVAPGPLTDALVASAGRVWAELLGRCATDPTAPDPLDLLPAGLPAGPLDAALRSATLAATRETPLLVPAGGGPLRAPADATVLAGPLARAPAVVAALGAWWPALVHTPRSAHAVRLLEITAVDLSDLIEGLPDLSPERARDLYGVFDAVVTAGLEELAMLPVPLVDGRTVRGVRGLVVVGALDADLLATLGQWGLRIVHPDAVHPLLGRLGAEHGDAAGLLDHPVLRDRVLDGGADHDDEEYDAAADGQAVLSPAEVLLRLIRVALGTGELRPRTWWGEVLLPAHDGDLVPAHGLTVAGSDAAGWFDPEVLPPADPGLTDRWGPEVLEAVGVRTSLRTVVIDVDEDTQTRELDGWDDYREEIGVGEEVDELVAVADLDAVRPQAWPAALRALADGPARHALTPVRLRGRARAVPSYATWWLRTRADIGLGAPFALAGSVTHHLSAVLPPAPEPVAGLDPQVQRWLGGVGGADELDPQAWADLLAGHRVGDPLPLSFAVAAWRAIAAHVGAGETGWADVAALPALVGPGDAALRDADDVAVGSPMWAQHPAARPLLIVPRGAVGPVAETLDLRPAEERAAGRVTSTGEPADTPPAVRAVFPAAPSTWVEHEDLRVDGEPVDWWVTDQVHAATTAGLARGLAEVVGGHVGHVQRLLGDPGAVAEVLLDLAGEPGGGPL